MNDAIDRAFARRRLARLARLLALAERDVQAAADCPRRDELRRDVGILRGELEKLKDASPPAPDHLDDHESEYVELEAEIREHEETLHVADNAAVYLERALGGSHDASAEVHRAQRWLDRLRRELATSAMPPDPGLVGADLAGVDAAFASRGAAALERARASVDLARRRLRAALVDHRRRAAVLRRRVGESA